MKIKKADATILEGDMTPMIDMTFQLVAFLMVLVNFNAEEVTQRVKLPLSKLARPPEKPAQHPVLIQMDGKGKLIYAGEDLPIEAIRNRLRVEKTLLANMPNRPSAKDATVIIRADQNAKTGDVQQLIKICQEEDFQNFVLRAKEESEY